MVFKANIVPVERGIHMSDKPSFENGNKQLFGFTVKFWVKFLVFFICIILLIFEAVPFLAAVILNAVYPDKDFSGIMGLAEGITFIVGLLGTIASAASIIMTLMDRKRYNAENKLVEKQQESVEKIFEMTQKMSIQLEQTSAENHKMAIKILKDDNENPALSVSSDEKVASDWNQVAQSEEKIG